MTVLSPTALIAAQVYGTASQATRREAPATPQRARFEVEDQVNLSKSSQQRQPQAQTQRAAASEPQRFEAGVGRREAVTAERPAPKRPGSLIDIKA